MSTAIQSLLAVLLLLPFLFAAPLLRFSVYLATSLYLDGRNMGFGDIKTTEGVKALNEYMADKSYIEGFVPSQADVAMFQALDGAPAACFPHALRWYKHIKSYEKSASSLPGVQKPLGQYGPAGCDAVPAATNTKGRKSDDDDDDDDLDLFGSDEENEESKTIREERLAQYAAKKSNKPAVIAKSSVVLDVKPWDDETDMAEVEKHVRSVIMEGLIWGASKLVPVGYGIKKLQMQCVIEDDKVSVDLLEELITAFEDHVQSVDVAAFNKI